MGASMPSQPKRRRVDLSEDEEAENSSPTSSSDAIVLPAINVPRTGWRCPGIIPDAFYAAHAELVQAFAKYYVGTYRVTVVRDIRSDRHVQ
ncbi:hypothetical protein PINS_up010483 [Pythium insidiosum]|nr:hypothetical protein PINS_up010483 [Pythium insidiosum]